MNRIAARREEASAFRVAHRYSVTDPEFNYREIIKQMVLLEDHLFHPYKACPDCIQKHLLTIEAFAEEIPSLGMPTNIADADPAKIQMVPGVLAECARLWIEAVLRGEDLKSIGDEVRKIRKDMIPLFSNPSDQADRIASAYIARRFVHSH